jgi:transposase
MGRSRGGLTSKIHAVVDSSGLPVRLALTTGEAHDNRLARHEKRTIHSAGNTASTPCFFTKTTTNFAGFVVLALRPTMCTSFGPS